MAPSIHLYQYHTFIRARDPKSLEALQLAKDTFKRITSEECFVRGRIGELVALLYNTAASVNTWSTTGQQVSSIHCLHSPSE